MNANLIHKWLRDPRFALEDDAESPVAEDMPDFLPVEIEGAVQISPRPDIHVSAPALAGPVSAQRVDIMLTDGRRILVEGSTALSAVLALVEGLMP